MAVYNLGQPINRRQEILRLAGVLLLVGVAFFGVAMLAPAGNPYQGAFFQPALETTWRRLLDLPAAWSSIRILLFSVGMFLVIEAIGTVLALMKLRSLALAVFFLQVLPVLCFLCGSYYLVKSLL